MTDTKNKLMDHAAQLIQTRGYNGFSFHDLAALVNVRTASIHYHFPTKLALGQAVVERYANEFVSALGSPESGTSDERLRHYIALFRHSLSKERMCLCGMIGAEIAGLPIELRSGINKFFEANIFWLSRIFVRNGAASQIAHQRALTALATLEGALMLARAKDTPADFETISAMLLSHIEE
jgi:TetR/AcrR family transcriptional regulator, transcriptional repressor for nem operon